MLTWTDGIRFNIMVPPSAELTHKTFCHQWATNKHGLNIRDHVFIVLWLNEIWWVDTHSHAIIITDAFSTQAVECIRGWLTTNRINLQDRPAPTQLETGYAND